MYNKRQSSFELIRVVAMLLIVLHHSIVHGVFINNINVINESNPLTYSLFSVLGFGGEVGVYLFVFITGYFMIYSKVTVKKIIKLWLPILFWSVILTLGLEYLQHSFSFKSAIKSFFPIITNQYWFMTTYVFLYILIPFINSYILQLNVKKELWLIILGLIIFLPGHFLYGQDVWSGFTYFIIVYFFGAIIRKHKLLIKNWFNHFGKIILWFALVITFVVSFSFSYLGFQFNKPKLVSYATVLIGQTTFICLLAAVGIFIEIGSKKIKYNKFINSIASTTFGIYLIHDNPTVREWLWTKALHFPNLISKPAYIIFYILFVVLIIFFVCSILEMIRKTIFSRVENKIANKSEIILKKFNQKYNNKLSEIISKITN